MIPNFKTFIKESIWSDIHKRSNGESIRKEDKTNIDEIKPVDIGASVLWADRDLEKQGEYLFLFDDIQIDSKEWRLPTKEEFEELEVKFFGKTEKVYVSEHAYQLRYTENNITYTDDELIYKNKDNGAELVLVKRGSCWPGNTRVDYVGDFYDAWGNDDTSRPEDLAYECHIGKETFKIGECLKNGKSCVRLVKDK